MSHPDLRTPDETGCHDGLAWSLHLPEPPGPASTGVVILHGADSRKESHGDFAIRCARAGLAALAFDARGHGASPGRLDGRAIDDVTTMASLLRERSAVTRLALRGSSLGGYLALVAAAPARADAVVAICPAPAAGLVDALRSGRFGFPADLPALCALLTGHGETPALVGAAAAGIDVLLQHAEGDESVPVAVSQRLHAAAPRSRLTVVPGGDHRSVQHEPQWQDEAIAFLLGGGSADNPYK